ncbi:putative F-box/kelch-repeat protein At1g12870 [Chenopodium quinoa]|uniref:F-box domain-containing protein n=1 Tax=Chenopodium quinoa TaxID=63459 RepID=A0A803LMX2_CHEQI|nr:putative F-box/kelch-repeat protein At1g12870 [Chenopodium quinoa]
MERETQKPDSQTPTLPDDLIFEHILPELPLKSLTRFKSVSKLWLSTISSPKFTKSQFLLFSGNHGPHPLFTSVTLDQHGGVDQILKFNYNCNGKRIHVLGSCNGLVCFCDEYFNFYICNPFTENCNDVINRPENAPDFTPNKVISAGFGYVSSIDDYKIVCLIGKSTRYFSLALSNVYIFSLSNWKWERALSRLNVHGIEIDPVDRVPVLVNDALYWYASNINHIVEMNLINAEIRSFPLTTADMLNSLRPDKWVRLYWIKGRLCWRCGREVWSLNKDDMSWMKMYDLNFTGMRLLCVSEAGKWLVLNHKFLALLDSSKSFYRQYQGGTSFDGPIFSAWDYKMTSVSPFLE